MDFIPVPTLGLIGEVFGMAGNRIITQDILKAAFNFDAIQRILIWKYREDSSPQWNGRYEGTIAGCVPTYDSRYRVINFLGKTHLAHHLIWIYLYGYKPIELDHKDGDGLNNRPWNLREATSSQNKANRNIVAKGYHRHGRGYKARIKVDEQMIYLGIFDTEEEAHAVYIQASKVYFGEFARSNRLIRRI